MIQVIQVIQAIQFLKPSSRPPVHMHHLSAKVTVTARCGAMAHINVQLSGEALWVPADLRQKTLKPRGFHAWDAADA